MTSLFVQADSLRRQLQRVLVTPEDPAYDEARSLWNGNIDKRPALIARCANVEDVVAALSFARAVELDIAVRGGAHAYSGAASVEGGLVIDLSPLNFVEVDPDARVVHCGGGATMSVLDAATQKFGLAVTGGMVSHTGVGGLALGGGYGWLTHACGLLVDNFVSAEVVLADGSVVRASATENPDLFWALRGGGGNFGIVTTFEFKLYEVGPELEVSAFYFDVEQSADALRLARDTLDRLPRDGGGVVTATPSSALIPPGQDFAPGPVLVLAGFGEVDAHRQRVAEVLGALKPAFLAEQRMRYVDLQQMMDTSAPWGIKSYSKGSYLEDLSDDAVDVLAKHITLKQSPFSTIPMFPLGGAYLDAAEDSTSLASSRAIRWNVAIDALAQDNETLAREREWVRKLWDALQPYANGIGGYVNFMAEYEADRVKACYGSKYQRLAEIKGRFDPDNVFHHNANIVPVR